LTLRFRPTVWPGQPVPVPHIPAVDKVSREGGWLFLDQPMSKYVEVPSEVYLREFRDTDPADVDQLAQLCSLGIIRPLSGARYFADLPWVVADQWLRELAVVANEFALPFWGGDQAEGYEARGRQKGWPVHATEVALRVRYAQRCTEHLLAYAAGEPLRQAWRDCEDDDKAWHNFTEVTGAALRDFHVRVGGVHTTLYSVAMLQLVNDLAEEVPYLTCANETCGRHFVRQRGRSEYGGHRMLGVSYCSNSCARAQYQRQKRRRDRAAQKGAGHE
jgi:hypothetical protein